MRQRLLRDKPAKTIWDLKLRDGGLIEIEFIVQVLQLILGEQLSPNTGEAIVQLRTRGALTPDDAGLLAQAHEDYAALTQLIRAAHGAGFDPETASEPFAERLAAACEETDLDGVQHRLDRHTREVRQAFEIYVGLLSD